MERIEKLGAFYIGRVQDPVSGETTSEEVMYDSRDLTTHAVCVGMTGSGKTGLCIGILEEAALDGVPAIIIDPKGDITNLLLAFPDLLPGDFKPWVNVDDAARKGLSVEDYAVSVAETWRKGLAEWGQDSNRIRRFRSSAEFRIYTPGSDAGTGISILSALAPPALSWETEAELLREQIEGVATALLGLMGIQADPLQSREFILLSGIIEHFWRRGEALDLPMLINSVQKPPMIKLGVFDTDTFFPEKDRFRFAIMLNGMVASPGFQSWLSGEPLDIPSFLSSPSGKPRHSIIYLAHLSESQRMFFVTLLLEKLLVWMRAQSGTTSLRALVYFDEVFGYLPPVAEPPSKKPLLTLLKQARAFGLGLSLTTQNPVDLDYKGLSNAGTWFVGRLQTERDKARLLDGLESASVEAGSRFDRAAMNTMISSLGSRVFILHNVHEQEPVLFKTRWAMSYLRGPLTRDQIRTLSRGHHTEHAQASSEAVAAESPAFEHALPEPPLSEEPPALGPGVQQWFMPPALSRGQAVHRAGEKGKGECTLVYTPGLFADASVSFLSARHGVSHTENRGCVLLPDGMGTVIDWKGAEPASVEAGELMSHPEPEGRFHGAFPGQWISAAGIRSVQKSLSDHLYYGAILEIFSNPVLKLHSQPEESLEEFRVRCRDKAREQRDGEVDKLRERTGTRIDRLRTRLEREQSRLEEAKDTHKGRKSEELLSAGETLAGVLGIFGRRRTTGLSSAARRRRMTQTAKSRIDRSEDEIKRLEEEMKDLEQSVKDEAEDIAARWEDAQEGIETVELKPRRTDVEIKAVVPVWLPVYRVVPHKGAAPVEIPAWKTPDQ
jgi:hypothetical protein